MKQKKLLVLLPDGVGLRNFAFTSFVEIGESLGWEVVFWNQTPFELSELGLQEIALRGKPRPLTDLFKRAKINAELDLREKRFRDPVYQTYKFPSSNTGLKAKLKNILVSLFTRIFNGEKGVRRLQKRMKATERKSTFYTHCKDVLEREKPSYVFCTNQRPINALTPLTAAQDLGIPTGTFIFSWDNLPKATMVVETDHYFVWSEHMKQELLYYYPFLKPDEIIITGSPQFEPHFDLSLRKERTKFYEEQGLDQDREYICFSGDDETTSPDDPGYLEDLAEAVNKLNNGETKFGIIFRRCPVDFSGRYNEVLEKYKALIVPVAPKWKKMGGRWNSILPTKEDLELQINTILHSSAVVNLASSMVFDFAVLEKPCLYLNYEVDEKADKTWSPQKVYNFVHFRSMPSKSAVIWLNSKNEIKEKITFALTGAPNNLKQAQLWFQKINLHPPREASERIWEGINNSL